MRTAAAGVVGMVGGQMIGTGSAGAASDHRRHRSVLGSIRLISLSHLNDPATTIEYPGDPEFTLDTIATIPEHGYYLQFVHEGEHTGTHWGAPGHFNEGALLADQMDLEDLFLPAVKVDMRHKTLADPDYGVTVADLRAWERRHGRFPRNAMVVLRTGWAERWGTDAFANLDADGVIHQPGFLLEAVEWLVEKGTLGRRGGTGTDAFSPDRGIDSDFAVSLLVYQRHRISLEVLNNLGALPTRGAYVLVGGPINKNGSGGTANILGLLPPH